MTNINEMTLSEINAQIIKLKKELADCQTQKKLEISQEIWQIKASQSIENIEKDLCSLDDRIYELEMSLKG